MGGVPESVRSTEEEGGVGQHVYAFVGLDGTSAELGLPTHNIWSFPTAGSKDTPTLTDVWKSLTPHKGGSLPAFLDSDEACQTAQLPCFISFPSAKDAKYND